MALIWTVGALAGMFCNTRKRHRHHPGSASGAPVIMACENMAKAKMPAPITRVSVVVSD